MSRVQVPLDRANSGVVLAKAVASFSRSFCLRIGDQFRFKRAAISPLALFTRHFLSLASFSASRATISRVIKSFSK